MAKKEMIYIGDEFDETYKGSFILEISRFVDKLEPPNSIDMDVFDPAQFFITSGEAIQKTRYMGKVAWKYASDARSYIKNKKKPTKKEIEFEKLCWKNAGAVTKLMNAFDKARAGNVFLEVEWKDGKVVCTRKNPKNL